MARLINFFDGATTGVAPTLGNIVASNLVTYADDAAFEAGELGSPVVGNIYYNTTDNRIRYYNGSSWTNVVAPNTTDTLTNKSIDADQNTITNIENADIKAAAAIDATKIADGTVTNTEFQYINTLNDNAQDQIDTAQATADANTADIADIRTTTGTSDGDVDMGVYASPTISNNQSIKQNIIDAAAQIDQNASDIATLQSNPAFSFQGSWNASTNTPTLTNGVGTTGHAYKVSVAGTVDFGAGNIDFIVGDLVYYDGSVWDKDKEAVTSVAGKQGAVTLVAADITDFDAEVSNNASVTANTAKVSADGSIDTHSDVDTSTVPPTEGQVLTWNSTDSEWQPADSSGGSGGGSGYPLIAGDNADFETTVGDWEVYADAAGASPVDMDAGSPTLTATRTTSSPHVGGGSLLITKDAANRQGEGAVLQSISIPSGYQGQPILVRLIGEGSVNYADGDLVLYAYDETNTEIIGSGPLVNQDNGQLPNSKTIVEALIYPKSNTASIRAGFHVATANASAWTYKIDQVEISWVPYISLPNIGNWKEVTPSYTNAPAGTSEGWEYRIDGPDLLLRGKFTGSATGPAADFRLNVGTMLPQYTLVVGGDTSGGFCATYQAGGDVGFSVAGIQVFSSTQIRVFDNDSGSTLQGNGIISGTQLRFDLRLKIEELSANTTNALAINGGLQFEEKILSADVTTNTTMSDLTIDNLVVGRKYHLTGQFYIDTPTADDVIFITAFHNSIQLGNCGGFSASGLSAYAEFSLIFIAETNTITFLSSSITAGNEISGNGTRNFSYVQLQEIPFSQTALMQRNIGFLATSDAGNSVPNNTVVDIAFEDEEFDNFGTYNPGTGVYTAPADGLYHIDATVVLSGLTPGTGELVMYVTTAANSILRVIYEESIQNGFQSANGSTKLYLNEGDQIKIRMVHNNGASRNIGANSNSCSFSAAKVV